MYCKNCGNPIDPQSATCLNCGITNGAGANFCFNCGSVTQPGAMICSNCGCSVGTIYSGNRKSKLIALLLAFFLGGFGIHDFYLGYTRNGILKIILTCCTGFGGGVWALIDFIRLISGSLHTDASGVELKKEF